MDKPAKRRPGIYIVNLQWTPKDCQATIKINGKCDVVMEKLMKYLSITVPKYSRNSDPIFIHATDLCKEEIHTTNRPFLTNIKLETPVLTEIKQEKIDLDDCDRTKTSVLDRAIFDKTFKNKSKESCVTSCKKEILIDTGQGDLKFIKKELIVITIRSGDNFEDCCTLFKVNQSHNYDCPNFVDEKNDIPVIIEDDIYVFKKNVPSSIKVENLFGSELERLSQKRVETPNDITSSNGRCR